MVENDLPFECVAGVVFFSQDALGVQNVIYQGIDKEVIKPSGNRLVINPPEVANKLVSYRLTPAPVQVIQHPITATSGDTNPQPVTDSIRFCRWLDAFQTDASSKVIFNEKFADLDRDRFCIKINGIIPNLTKIKIKSTDLHGAVIHGAFVNKTTDGDYEVKMKVEGGGMISAPVLLVSDGDDDKTYNGSGADDDDGDQTLLADFGSKIVVAFPEFGNAQVEFTAQSPVGEVTLNLIYCSVAGDVPQIKRDEIYLQIRKMREIYRQIGIKVNVAALHGEKFPAEWLEPRGPPGGRIDLWEKADHLSFGESSSLRAIIQNYQVPAKQIRVGFVDASMQGEFLNQVWGWTFKDHDCALVSLKGPAVARITTTAHEVGHTLGLLDLTDQFEIYWLMFERGLLLKNSHLDSKRFKDSQDDMIKSKNFFYVPLR